MTTPTLPNTGNKISAGSIIVGALIGLGVCIVFAALGGAVGATFGDSDPKDVPSTGLVILVSFFAIAALSFAFLVAGYVASRVAHQQVLMDSILHSLGTWAVMAIFLVLLVAVTSSLESVRASVKAFRPPAMVTDMKLLEGQAVTKIVTPPPRKDTPEERSSEKRVAASWWVAFWSLIFGAAGSVFGGLYGRKKGPKILEKKSA